MRQKKTYLRSSICPNNSTCEPIRHAHARRRLTFSSGGHFISALTLSPNNRNLFASNIFDGMISTLAVHDGSLQPILGSPVAAADFLVGGLETTRAGKFLYVALVGLGAVDAFSVGPGGVLTPVPGRPFFTGQSAVFVLSLTTFPGADVQQ